MKVTVRKQTPGDIAAIRAVNSQAFGQTAEGEIVDRLRKNCRD